VLIRPLASNFTDLTNIIDLDRLLEKWTKIIKLSPAVRLTHQSQVGNKQQTQFHTDTTLQAYTVMLYTLYTFTH